MQCVKIYCVLLLGQILIACSQDNAFDCIKRTGKNTLEERTVGKYNSVQVDDNINIVVRNGDLAKITVEAGQNLLTNIITKVEGNQLKIKNNNTCNWTRSYEKKITVYLSLPTVCQLVNFGWGEIKTEGEIYLRALNIHYYGPGDGNLNLNCDYLWIDLDKSANVTVTGNSKECEFTNNLQGTFLAGGCNCRSLVTRNKGEGSMEVYASETLKAYLFSIGNIYYKGNPSIVLEKIGKGELIKLD